MTLISLWGQTVAHKLKERNHLDDEVFHSAFWQINFRLIFLAANMRPLLVFVLIFPEIDHN